MKKLEDFKDSFGEVCTIAKTVLSTVWFWVPVAYALYFLVQLWLIFFVHPLTLFAVVTVLGVYAVYLEDKRTTTMYSLKKTKFLSASHGFGEGPSPIDRRDWDVEQTVNEYEVLLRKRKQRGK